MGSHRGKYQKQILREAEGYLELITCLADRWPPRPEIREPIAKRALELLGQVDPAGHQRATWLLLKGEAFRTMNRYGEALEPLLQSAELDEENIGTWLALGWCYKRTGRLDLAIESLEKALVSDDQAAIIHYNLACYWALANNPNLAVGYLQRALEIDPDYKNMIADEPDFEPIRDYPEFQVLAGVIV